MGWCAAVPQDWPFLVTLWKDKAAQPYLALWVASPDVLVPFVRKPDKGTGRP